MRQGAGTSHFWIKLLLNVCVVIIQWIQYRRNIYCEPTTCQALARALRQTELSCPHGTYSLEERMQVRCLAEPALNMCSPLLLLS